MRSNFHDPYSDTHHLECPRCGRHSIVLHGEGRYICLNCNWQRNVSGEWDIFPFPLILIAIIVMALMIIT